MSNEEQLSPTQESLDSPKKGRDEYARIENSSEEISLEDAEKEIGAANIASLGKLIDKATKQPEIQRLISENREDNSHPLTPEEEKIATAALLSDVVENYAWYTENDPGNPVLQFYNKDATSALQKIKGGDPLAISLGLDLYIAKTKKEHKRQQRLQNPAGVIRGEKGRLEHTNDLEDLLTQRAYTNPETGEIEGLSSKQIKDEYMLDSILAQTIKRSLIPKEELIRWGILESQIQKELELIRVGKEEKQDRKQIEFHEESASQLASELLRSKSEYNDRIENVLQHEDGRSIKKENKDLFKKYQELSQRFKSEELMGVVNSDTMRLSLSDEEKEDLAARLGVRKEEIEEAQSLINKEDEVRAKRIGERYSRLNDKVDTRPGLYRARAFKILWNIRRRQETSTQDKLKRKILNQRVTFPGVVHQMIRKSGDSSSTSGATSAPAATDMVTTAPQPAVEASGSGNGNGGRPPVVAAPSVPDDNDNGNRGNGGNGESPPGPNPVPSSPERRLGHARIINSTDEIPIEDIPGSVGQRSIDTVSRVLDEAINDPEIARMIERRFLIDQENGAPGNIDTDETKKIILANLLEDIVRRTARYEAEDPENPLLRFYQQQRTGSLLNVKNSDAPTIVLALEYIQVMEKRAYNENARRSDREIMRARRSNPTSVDQSPDGALADAGGLTYLLERTYIDPETGEERSLEHPRVKEDYTFDRMIAQILKRRVVPIETLFEWEVLSLQARQAEENGDSQRASELRQQLTNEQYQYDERIRDALEKPDNRRVRLENRALHNKVQAVLREFAREGFVSAAQNREEMLADLTGNTPEALAERQRLLDLLGPKINATPELLLEAAAAIRAQDEVRMRRSEQRFNALSAAVDKDPLKYRQRAFKILWNIEHRQLRQTALYNEVTHLRNKRYTQDPNEQGPEGDINRSGIVKEPTPPNPPPPPQEELSDLPAAPVEGGPEDLPAAPIDKEDPPDLPTAPVEQMPKLEEEFNIGAAALNGRIQQEVGNLADHVIAHDANIEPRRQTRWGIFWGVGEAIRHPVRLWQNSMLRPVFRRQAEDFVLQAENAVKGTNNPIPIELTPELLDTMLTKGMEPPYRQGRFRRILAAPFRNVLGIGLKTDQRGGLMWLRDEMAKTDPSQRDATLRASRDRMLTEQNKLGERYAEIGEGLSLEASNRLALKQGDLEETRHLLEPTEEQKTALNNKVKELLTRYHTDNTFTDEELVKAFNNYLQIDFIQYVPDQYKAEFTAPEYASNILAIAHQVDGRNPDGTRIEGSTMWEDYHKTGENNTPSAWDKLKFNIYYGKGEWGAVRGKNEETLNTRWLARRLESRDYRQSTGTAKGVEYATAVVTYGGSYALAYGAALATIGRGTVARMIPFVGPASVAAIRESGLGWSFRGKWRGFKGNVAREIEQASREAARGRDLQAGSPLRAEYEKEALVGRKNAQDYINTINQALNNEQPTDDQMNTLLIELADLKARLDLSDASSTKDLNYKVQNFITYRQGEENEQNAQLRKALQDGVVKLQSYATSNANFMNNRATEIVSQNGRDGLLEKYALVMNAQLRMSSDGQQMSRWLRQTGLNDTEITQLLALHAALPQERRNISRQESFARKEWNQRRLSARKAAKMFAVTGALSLGTAGLLSETGSFINSPSKDLARWRDIVNGNTPSSDAGATSSIQRAVIFAVNNADRIPYADNAGQMVSEVVGTVPGATGQVLSDIHATAQAAQDHTGDFINSVPVAGPIAGGAYGSTKQLADHFIKVGRERGTELTQEVRPTIDIAQEKGGQLIDKIPYTDRISNASNAIESTASTGFEDIRQASDSLTLPEGVEITTEDGKKFISYEDTKVDITGLSLESIPPSESNDFTGQIVIKDTAGNIITTDPANFFHEKGIPLEMDYKIGDPIHEQLLDSSLPLHKEAGSQFPDTLIPGGTHWQGDDLVLDSDPNHVLIHDVRIDNNTGEILFQTDHDPAVDYSGAAGTEIVLNNTGEITLDPTNLRSNIPPGTQIVANTDGSFDLVVKNDPSIELIQGVRVDSTTGEVTYDSIHSGVHFTSETGPTTTILQSGLEGKLTPTDLDANLPPGIKAEHLANGNIRLYPEADQSITLLEGKFDGNTFTTLHASSELKVIETITPETHLTGDAAKAELLTYGTQVEWGTGYWNDTSIAEKAELQMHTFHTLNGNGNHVLTVSLLTNPYDTAQQTGVGEIYLPDVIREDKIALTIWLPDHTGTPILLRDSMDGKIDGSFTFDPDSTTPITLGNRTTTIGELTKMVIDGDALAATPMGNNATEYNQFFNVGKLGADGKYGYFSTAYIARDGNNPLLREITTIKYNGGLNIATPGSAEYAFKTIDDITKESSVYKLQIDEITKRAPGFIAVQDITEDHATKVPFLLISDIPDDSGFSLDIPYPPFVPGRRNIEKSRLGDRQATGEATAATTPNTPQTPTPGGQDDNNAGGTNDTDTAPEPEPVPPLTTPEPTPDAQEPLAPETPVQEPTTAANTPQADAPLVNADDAIVTTTPSPVTDPDPISAPQLDIDDATEFTGEAATHADAIRRQVIAPPATQAQAAPSQAPATTVDAAPQTSANTSTPDRLGANEQETINEYIDRYPGDAISMAQKFTQRRNALENELRADIRMRNDSLMTASEFRQKWKTTRPYLNPTDTDIENIVKSYFVNNEASESNLAYALWNRGHWEALDDETKSKINFSELEDLVAEATKGAGDRFLGSRNLATEEYLLKVGVDRSVFWGHTDEERLDRSFELRNTRLREVLNEMLRREAETPPSLVSTANSIPPRTLDLEEQKRESAQDISAKEGINPAPRLEEQKQEVEYIKKTYPNEIKKLQDEFEQIMPAMRKALLDDALGIERLKPKDHEFARKWGVSSDYIKMLRDEEIRDIILRKFLEENPYANDHLWFEVAAFNTWSSLPNEEKNKADIHKLRAIMRSWMSTRGDSIALREAINSYLTSISVEPDTFWNNWSRNLTTDTIMFKVMSKEKERIPVPSPEEENEETSYIQATYPNEVIELISQFKTGLPIARQMIANDVIAVDQGRMAEEAFKREWKASSDYIKFLQNEKKDKEIEDMLMRDFLQSGAINRSKLEYEVDTFALWGSLPAEEKRKLDINQLRSIVYTCISNNVSENDLEHALESYVTSQGVSLELFLDSDNEQRDRVIDFSIELIVLKVMKAQMSKTTTNIPKVSQAWWPKKDYKTRTATELLPFGETRENNASFSKIDSTKLEPQAEDKIVLDETQAEIMLDVYPEEAKLMLDHFNTLLPIYERKYATELSGLSDVQKEKFLIDHIAPTIIGEESLRILISRIEELANQETGLNDASPDNAKSAQAQQLINKFLSTMLAIDLKRQADLTPREKTNNPATVKPLTSPKRAQDAAPDVYPFNNTVQDPKLKFHKITPPPTPPSVSQAWLQGNPARNASDLSPFGEASNAEVTFKKITPPPPPPSVSQQAWRQGQSLRSATSLSPFGDPTPTPETSFNRIKPSSTVTESTILSNQEEQKPNIPSSNSETSLLNSITKTYTEDINKMASTYIKDKPRIMSVLRSDIQEVDEGKISESAFKRRWGIDVSIVKQIDDKEIDGFLRDYFARRYYSDSSKLEDIITIRANWEALDEKTKKKISIQKLQEIAAEKGAYTEAIDNYLASINVTPAEFWGTSEDEVNLTESFRSNMTRNLLDIALSKRGL